MCNYKRILPGGVSLMTDEELKNKMNEIGIENLHDIIKDKDIEIEKLTEALYEAITFINNVSSDSRNIESVIKKIMK